MAILLQGLCVKVPEVLPRSRACPPMVSHADPSAVSGMNFSRSQKSSVVLRWTRCSESAARAPSSHSRCSPPVRTRALSSESAQRIPGKATWNVAPWSGFGVAQSRPRWLSMIERLIDSPMPNPPGFVV
jgi:hypothetical protein